MSTPPEELPIVPPPEDWTVGANAVTAGWYAVQYRAPFDASNTIVAVYFDGTQWVPPAPVVAFAGPFVDDMAAATWANEHAPTPPPPPAAPEEEA